MMLLKMYYKECKKLEEKYYDGKKYYNNLLNMTDEILPCQRWAKYCLTTEKIDIDVSLWAMEYYVKIYDCLIGNDPVNQKGSSYKYEVSTSGVIYRGDTMTSYANFIRKYFKEKDHLRNIGKEKCAEKIIEGESVEEYMEEFAYLSHTLGNLIPVPLYFNVERSGAFADCDYWDIAMYNIYRWCETGDDRYIYELLNRYNKNNHMAESIFRFKKWLSIYNCNWQEFVDRNYLNAFVDKDGYPIEFWNNHFAFNRKIDSLSSSEFKDTVELINKLIINRNKDIVDRNKNIIIYGGVSN